MPSASTLLVETQYLPPVALFAKAKHFAYVHLEAYEHYQKGGYRNRCLIVGANGVQMLSIPLEKGKHQQTPIKEVKISNKESWQMNHWRSIQSAYGKSPFFEYYALDFEPFYTREFNYLFDWNLELLNTIIDLMDFSFSVQETKQYNTAPLPDCIDFRNQLQPKHRIKKGTALPHYPQVFEAKNGFIPNLSILDLLFCAGPEAIKYLDPNPNK